MNTTMSTTKGATSDPSAPADGAHMGRTADASGSSSGYPEIAYGTPATAMAPATTRETMMVAPPMQQVNTYGSTGYTAGGGPTMMPPPRMPSIEWCCGNRVVESGISSLYNDDEEFTMIDGCCGKALLDLRMVATPTGTGKISVDTCCTDVVVVHSPYQRIQFTGDTCCVEQQKVRDKRTREMKALGFPPTQSTIILDADMTCGQSNLYIFDVGQSIDDCSCCGGIF